MSDVFRTFDPPPPLHPASVSSPRTKGGGGVHTRRAVRGWGVNILEDARHCIGLLQYNPSTFAIVKSKGGYAFEAVLHKICQTGRMCQDAKAKKN